MSSHLGGLIDEVKFFNRAVTAAEFWDLFSHVYVPFVCQQTSGDRQ